jgi:hypothetical protein
MHCVLKNITAIVVARRRVEAWLPSESCRFTAEYLKMLADGTRAYIPNYDGFEIAL